MGNRTSKSGSRENLGRTTLFEKESDGTTYRIPALIYLKHSHTFLAFAEKRSSTKDEDAKNLVMRRGEPKDDGNVQWSPSEDLLMASLKDHRTMNPCPVYEKNSKTLFLFFICVWGNTTEKWQINMGRNKAQLCYVSSKDDGKNWTEAKDLTEAVIGDTIKNWATFAVGPGHGVQLENGRLIIPAYAYYVPHRIFTFPIPGTVYPRAFCIYSEDLGQTWHLGNMLEGWSCECEMAEIIDREGTSRLYCNARYNGGHRWEALSDDNGVTFVKPHVATELVETGKNGCQGSIIGFPAPEGSSDTKTWLLFTHPTDCSNRKSMGVYLNRSPLDSLGWAQPWIVNSGPSGYSDLAYNADKDQFSCLMECGKDDEAEQIAFVSFTLNEVMQTFEPEPAE